MCTSHHQNTDSVVYAFVSFSPVFRRHNIFDMQDNLGSSEIHDDNLIVVENNTKSSTMPSVVNPYHENEREIENATVALKSKQNVNAADTEINAIPLDCDAAAVSNLICDISNVQLADQRVGDDIDEYKNTAIMATPSPTPKSNSKSTNTSKRCKKCNCVCDKSAPEQSAQRTIRTRVDCQWDESGVETNDPAGVEPAVVSTT